PVGLEAAPGVAPDLSLPKGHPPSGRCHIIDRIGPGVLASRPWRTGLALRIPKWPSLQHCRRIHRPTYRTVDKDFKRYLTTALLEAQAGAMDRRREHDSRGTPPLPAALGATMDG